MSAKSPGQIAYEADLEKRPVYHSGEVRPSWDQLPAYARENWDRIEGRNAQVEEAARP